MSSSASKFVHARPVAPALPPPIKASVENLSFYYGDNEAVKSVSLPIYEHKITALIGPSGCGKTTLLRCFNRLHELYAGNRHTGSIRLQPDDFDLMNRRLDPIAIRLRVSMVFQKPNPFPKTIFENIAYGLRLANIRARSEL
ncbi:MAG TPA: ATP-binding cassette domain-containing protein, partial [Opitutaceae bacterium]